MSLMEPVVLKPHPLATLFLPMSAEEYAELKADIGRNGLLEPITMHENMILDGTHRYRACRELGIEVRTREWPGFAVRTREWAGEGGSPIAFVASKNLRRRHLDVGQRAMIGARLLPELEREAKARQEASQAKPGERIGRKVQAELPEPSRQARDDAARVVHVSPRSISAAKQVMREAPDLAAQVERGEMKLHQAAKASRSRALAPEVKAARKAERDAMVRHERLNREAVNYAEGCIAQLEFLRDILKNKDDRPALEAQTINKIARELKRAEGLLPLVVKLVAEGGRLRTGPQDAKGPRRRARVIAVAPDEQRLDAAHPRVRR